MANSFILTRRRLSFHTAPIASSPSPKCSLTASRPEQAIGDLQRQILDRSSSSRKGQVTVRTPTFSVEVITLPVRDVGRALRFYVDQVGFTLDVDYSPNDAFRVVQLTPPGSSCSIQIGNGPTDAPVGSLRNVYLVVTDLEAAR